MESIEERIRAESKKFMKQCIEQNPEDKDVQMIAKFRDNLQTGDAEVEPISLEKARKLMQDTRGSTKKDHERR